MRRALTMTCSAVQVKGFWLQFKGFAFISALELSVVGVGGALWQERALMSELVSFSAPTFFPASRRLFQLVW